MLLQTILNKLGGRSGEIERWFLGVDEWQERTVTERVEIQGFRRVLVVSMYDIHG